ncbi:hypothetical protein HN587_02790 [Candidatus Woesearchaeota archaeon]|jgi:hypothetical protein|nr:hypothetical protein [Candidatus Woesearchaeota archaeon]
MENIQININKIANSARDSIGVFCFTECGAYCCRKGALSFGDKSVDLVTDNNSEKFIRSEELKEIGPNEYLFDLSVNGCPRLDDNKCSAHKSNLRPDCCKDFPIFIDHKNKKVRLSPRCLAVKKMLLYSFEKEVISLGYSINTCNPD